MIRADIDLWNELRTLLALGRANKMVLDIIMFFCFLFHTHILMLFNSKKINAFKKIIQDNQLFILYRCMQNVTTILKE